MSENNEQKPAAEALQQSEQRFRFLIDSFPLFFWESRADGAGLFGNKRMLEYLDLSLEQVQGRGWLETIHPDDRGRVTEAWEHSIRTGEAYSVETRIRSGRTGEYRWFLTLAVPHRNCEGQISRWFGTCVDIQKSKQIEHSLRESEERFRTVLDNMPGGVFAHDLDGRILMINDAAIRNTGYAKEELLNMSVADVDPESVTRDDRTRLWHRLSKGRLNTIESIHIRKDGSEYPTEVHLNAIELGGRPVILAIAFDRTLRKKFEGKLRESEERMRLLIEYAPAALAMFDREMRYLSASRRWLTDYKLWGRSVIGRSHYDVFPEIPEFWKRVHRRALKGEVVQNDGDRFERKDGSVQWLRWEVRPWHDHKGNIAGIAMFTEDITARRQAEEALRNLNETLEQRVAERTDLAESRARQLQALAVELIEAEEREKQRIAALLHDDLQQLLAAARFMLQSPSNSDADRDEVQRLLEESIRKSRHLSHELSPAVLHRSGLKAALEGLFLRMREQFGLTIQLDTLTGRQVRSTPLKVFIFRAVKELLFNVVKHSGATSARVQLSATPDEFVVTVSDTGRGFDTSILDRYTPHPGLGLLSLRERASYVGGRLTIESTPGQGSRLILRVPTDMDTTIRPGHPAAKIEEKARIMEISGKIADEQGIRVLFADDHKVLRQGLIRLISGKPNISVAGEAANGREALELTRQLRPDVVVMDISMPVMDGIEATRRIKAELPDVRVIGLSMHDDQQVARTMRDAGAEALVSKAASSSVLLKAIYGINGEGDGTRPQPAS